MLFSTLFSFSGTLKRREYLLIALVSAILKHALDFAVSSLVFHREWTPLNYLIPLGIPVTAMAPADRFFLAEMVALSLPFAWVGIAITVKRFRTIGWPLWMAVLFFVPIANIVSFAIAAAWPEREKPATESAPRWLERVVPADALGSATLALVLTAAASIVCIALGTKVLATYGWGLFAAIPFSQGALAAFLIGVHRPRGLGACILVALLSVALTSLALLAVALEGAICIAMATPLACAFAAIGALFGYVLQRRPPSGQGTLATLLVCTLVAPVVMGAEAAMPREAPTYRVESSVIVDAPPATVWRNVVSFPDLPPPNEALFHLGIAYPQRARIAGEGVGAIRYCEFSTGTFVEPITVWEPGRELAFDVRRSAEPMRELSFYRGVDTPHLHGFMVSRRGEFLLEPLPGGRTKLIGITWYQHHLWPAAYWALFAGPIVHSIHLRVLNHVKNLSERVSGLR